MAYKKALDSCICQLIEIFVKKIIEIISCSRLKGHGNLVVTAHETSSASQVYIVDELVFKLCQDHLAPQECGKTDT